MFNSCMAIGYVNKNLTFSTLLRDAIGLAMVWYVGKFNPSVIPPPLVLQHIEPHRATKCPAPTPQHKRLTSFLLSDSEFVLVLVYLGLLMHVGGQNLLDILDPQITAPILQRLTHKFHFKYE